MGIASEQPSGTGLLKKGATDAYVLFFVSLLLVVTLGLPLQALSLRIGLLITEVLLIFLPALLYVRLKRLPLAEALRWRPVAPGIAVRCVVLATLGWGTAAAIALATRSLSEPILGPAPSSDFLLPKTYTGFGILLFLGAVLAGVCEETLFRGAIQGTLERKGAWKGIVFTALLFATYHFNPWDFLAIVALGLLFGVVTVRTNSTLAAMVCHGCHNAVGITFGTVSGKWIEQQEGHVIWFILGPSALLFVIALLEFLHYTRGNERLASPLVAAPAQLSRRFGVIATAAGAGLAIAALVVLYGFLGHYRMRSDRLAPEINPGDWVIVVKTRWIDVDIQPGDVVAFKSNGTTFLRKVARVDNDDVWVVEDSSEAEASQTPIARSDIIAKVLHTLTWEK